ncbi:hypothetical protein EON65_13970 [archaeon]|nr:MAG: hypothetical protein EON65_13970 [archaeon]
MFLNAEKVRLLDAHLHAIPGLLASINDVTDGSEDIPSYAGACGVAEVAFENIQRRDLLTPYGSYALFLHDPAVGLCWYNNMLKGPRMQMRYGSMEAVNANGTEISPLTTWDSKITTVLAMTGGIGALTQRALASEKVAFNGHNAYEEFYNIVEQEHKLVFGSVQELKGLSVPLLPPSASVPHVLSDWDIQC